ncbi:uncharacterized protein CIMG_01794 [Coccidioides immitis RS]|uniref:Uncharacterized protein n=1 Tax=Coccidioides immitis (strain RS) TaxID=246410 RepID=J3KJY3_COCIM|nr:uncharacterized protein CIMG_01794 [Coccidioides immitis RS]EAS36440.3 hypothetical protein CIMG_01794 [Coccidioides immitis RS]
MEVTQPSVVDGEARQAKASDLNFPPNWRPNSRGRNSALGTERPFRPNRAAHLAPINDGIMPLAQDIISSGSAAKDLRDCFSKPSGLIGWSARQRKHTCCLSAESRRSETPSHAIWVRHAPMLRMQNVS